MKAAIIVTEETRQIILTPENEYEKMVLRLFKSDDKLSVYHGSLADERAARGLSISQCHGGWLRAYEDDDNLMLTTEEKNE